MTRWSIALLIIAVITGIIGFSGLIVESAALITRLLFFVFVILFLAALLFGRRLTD